MGEDVSIRNGAMLRVSIRPDVGQESVIHLLAWQPPRHTELRWELRRILPAVGYDEKGWKQLKTHVSANWTRWKAACELMGLPEGCMGLSLKALRGQGATADQLSSAAQEHVLSTAALLVLCLHWVDFRRQQLHKSMARALLFGFLSASLPNDSRASVVMANPPETCRAACEKGPFTDGMCSCLHSAWQESQARIENAPDGPAAAGKTLLALVTWWQCKAVRQWTGDIVYALATDIDAGWQTWGQCSWQKTEEAAVSGKKKQRRITPLLRDYIAEKAYTSKAHSMNQAVNLLERGYTGFGNKALVAEMAGLRTTLHLKADEIEPVWSLSLDAARLGRPSKEFLFGHLSMLPAAEHCMLPPQVP
eukprot:1972107-Amphidinium_carterae.4